MNSENPKTYRDLCVSKNLVDTLLEPTSNATTSTVTSDIQEFMQNISNLMDIPVEDISDSDLLDIYSLYTANHLDLQILT